MEFLYKLNAIPRLQIQPDGEIRISGGSKNVRNHLKRFATNPSEAETEGAVLIVPAKYEPLVRIVFEAQKNIILRNLSHVDLPLSLRAMSMHELENGFVCILGKPSPEAMLAMQQIGGEFSENILLGGDKLMGWVFKGDVVDQLQTLLSISPTPYSSPRTAAEGSHPKLSAVCSVVRRSERVSKVAKRSHAAANEVTPMSSAESAPLPKKLKSGGNKLRARPE